MSKPQFAILRFAKYKGPEISNIEAHNERTKEIIYPKEAETVKEIFRALHRGRTEHQLHCKET